MPLVAAGLSAAIKTKLNASFPTGPGGDAARNDFCDAIAAAVVEYLVANNLVTHPMGPGKLT